MNSDASPTASATRRGCVDQRAEFASGSHRCATRRSARDARACRRWCRSRSPRTRCRQETRRASSRGVASHLVSNEPAGARRRRRRCPSRCRLARSGAPRARSETSRACCRSVRAMRRISAAQTAALVPMPSLRPPSNPARESMSMRRFCGSESSATPTDSHLPQHVLAQMRGIGARQQRTVQQRIAA